MSAVSEPRLAFATWYVAIRNCDLLWASFAMLLACFAVFTSRIALLAFRFACSGFPVLLSALRPCEFRSLHDVLSTLGFAARNSCVKLEHLAYLFCAHNDYFAFRIMLFLLLLLTEHDTPFRCRLLGFS